MAVGILQIELRLLSPHSLKEKRAILNPMKTYLRKKRNVSVAEVNHYDLWQSTLIEIAMVGHDRKSLQSHLASIPNMLELRFPVHVCGEKIEIV